MRSLSLNKRPTFRIGRLIGLIFLCQTILFILVYIFFFNSLIKFINNLPGTRHLDDQDRNITEIIESRGFQQRTHFVQSKNGYIIQLIQIINPFVKDRSVLRPIFLQHGLEMSGSTWLLARDGSLDENGDYYEIIDDERIESIGSCLGFVLASKNYDVWLGNLRGNTYSANHTNYKSTDDLDSNYWSFSIDDMIEEDLPAIIDFVLERTNSSTLAYVGHSQGSFIMLGLLSTKPIYSTRIKPFIAISPVFYLTKVDTLLGLFTSSIPGWFLRKIPTRFPLFPKFFRFYSSLCENVMFKKLCVLVMYWAFGSNSEVNFDDRIGVQMGHLMAGSSSWNIAQYLQIIANGGTPQFLDLGDENLNLQRYGHKETLFYDASRINSSNIALIHSTGDSFNIPADVQRLKEVLSVELIDDYMINDTDFNHLDLVWSNRTGELVNERVLNILDLTL
ncbi:allergen [Sarcoptes scabiei]|nr:allergen [Sarcoptes scabiei]